MTRENVETFAARWAEAWNRRAVEEVLEHFHEDVVFTSPTALASTNAGEWWPRRSFTACPFRRE